MSGCSNELQLNLLPLWLQKPQTSHLRPIHTAHGETNLHGIVKIMSAIKMTTSVVLGLLKLGMVNKNEIYYVGN